MLPLPGPNLSPPTVRWVILRAVHAVCVRKGPSLAPGMARCQPALLPPLLPGLASLRGSPSSHPSGLRSSMKPAGPALPSSVPPVVCWGGEQGAREDGLYVWADCAGGSPSSCLPVNGLTLTPVYPLNTPGTGSPGEDVDLSPSYTPPPPWICIKKLFVRAPLCGISPTAPSGRPEGSTCWEPALLGTVSSSVLSFPSSFLPCPGRDLRSLPSQETLQLLT